MLSKGHKEPSEAILTGRRALENLKELTIIDDVIWYDNISKWVIHVRLSPPIPSTEYLPAITEWYMTIDENYPNGAIIFYPSRVNGINCTFPHQNYNCDIEKDNPWRLGRLCLETEENSIGRSGYDNELFSIEDRLLWHTIRALDWLKAASLERLLVPGDPFELPDYRSLDNSTVSFNETPDSLLLWNAIENRKGYAVITTLPQTPDVLVIKCFYSIDGKVVYTPQWGAAINGCDSTQVAGWIRLNQYPYIPPYQAPKNLTELSKACLDQQINLQEIIVSLGTRFRDNKSHILLVGFPIPEKVEGPLVQMHWLSMKLPVLSSGRIQGFEKNERGWKTYDKAYIVKDSMKLDWIDTDNWSDIELSGRGVLSKKTTTKRMLIIGAGAIGSIVAELLVRAGVKDITICDCDLFNAGNLVRHTLTTDALGKNKAAELAKHLNLASIHANVKAISSSFPPKEPDDIKHISVNDVIIDCTGSDKVLRELNQYSWDSSKLIISISIGLWAKRLFYFATTGEKFPQERYLEMINPWLEKQVAENQGQELPREGIGCWHPLFPARINNLWAMAGIAINCLDETINQNHTETELLVFEQVHDDDGFTGIQKVNFE